MAASPMRLPVFCNAAAGKPVTSNRLVVELQGAIGCGGVPVFSGDVVFGDGNCVCVITAHLAEEIAKAAEEREAFEAWVHQVGSDWKAAERSISGRSGDLGRVRCLPKSRKRHLTRKGHGHYADALSTYDTVCIPGFNHGP